MKRFFDPFEELRELTSEMDRILESAFRMPPYRARALPGVSREEKLAKFTPAVEVIEENDDYTVKLEIPGINPENVEVTISPENLTVKGEAKSSKEEEVKGYYYSEFRYGSFRRIIPFPKKVDESQAKASFKNGILEVKVPKVKEIIGERKLAIES